MAAHDREREHVRVPAVADRTSTRLNDKGLGRDVRLKPVEHVLTLEDGSATREWTVERYSTSGALTPDNREVAQRGESRSPRERRSLRRGRPRRSATTTANRSTGPSDYRALSRLAVAPNGSLTGVLPATRVTLPDYRPVSGTRTILICSPPRLWRSRSGTPRSR
ncbi:hypothetical protein OG948_59670 (plasmid) [Embleya sp. NBC_00888]|nr:hypothetical protein OG948_59670 [Embleya sp. NBC_00888]